MCESCYRKDREHRERMAEEARKNPIYKTDFSKPLSQIVEEIRNQICNIRGRLGDISRAYDIWEQQLDDVQGLLTCGLVTLHGISVKMYEIEKAREAATPVDEKERQET